MFPKKLIIKSSERISLPVRPCGRQSSTKLGPLSLLKMTCCRVCRSTFSTVHYLERVTNSYAKFMLRRSERIANFLTHFLAVPETFAYLVWYTYFCFPYFFYFLFLDLLNSVNSSKLYPKTIWLVRKDALRIYTVVACLILVNILNLFKVLLRLLLRRRLTWGLYGLLILAYKYQKAANLERPISC